MADFLGSVSSEMLKKMGVSAETEKKEKKEKRDNHGKIHRKRKSKADKPDIAAAGGGILVHT